MDREEWKGKRKIERKFIGKNIQADTTYLHVYVYIYTYIIPGVFNAYTFHFVIRRFPNLFLNNGVGFLRSDLYIHAYGVEKIK